MSPLWWTILMMTFIFTLLSVLISLYFNHSKKMISKINLMNKKIIWKL